MSSDTTESPTHPALSCEPTAEEAADPEFQARLLFTNDDEVNALIRLWAGHTTFAWQQLETEPLLYDMKCTLCDERIGLTDGSIRSTMTVLAKHNRPRHFVPALRREMRIAAFKQDLLDRVRVRRTSEDGTEVLQWSKPTRRLSPGRSS